MGYSVLFHAALETAKICLPTVIEARRGVLKQEDCDLRLRSWAARVLGRVEASVEVEGLNHVSESAGPFIVVSNHQSHYDIPVLYHSLPISLRMAAKAELFKTPLWGQALRDSGFVLIDRKHPERAHEELRKAGERMRHSGISLYVAPEGTRSPDGSLSRFRSGAFRIALGMELPVLPVAISGTLAIHRKGTRSIGKGRSVRVRVLPPFRPGPQDKPAGVAASVRELLEGELRRLK